MKLLLALVALMSGCIGQSATLEKYVCSDGWVVSSAADCGNRTLECPKCQACKCAEPKKEAKIAVVETKQKTDVVTGENPCESLGCPPGTEFVSSKSSGKYHACTCSLAARLSVKTRVCFSSAQEAQAQGKQPCGICVHGTQGN
jgi:hypothetical protein